MSAEPRSDPRRRLPSVDRVLARSDVQALASEHGRARVREAVRTLLEQERAPSPDPVRNEPFDEARLVRSVDDRLRSSAQPSLRHVINATGVVVHTNLGRAPLPREAALRIGQTACGYSNLELDLEAGSRGQREAHAEERLARLTGAEATAVVNNCAAAVLLALDTLASGREVIVSRGELVEIGGSFRIPDVLAKSGSRLVEVGTTNRTRLEDYRRALSPDTALILKVHPSNFRVVGFTEEAPLAGLADLARKAGVPLVEDLGSGLLNPGPGPLSREPCARNSLATGVDLLTMSGDKLFGGPQAGLVVGKAPLVSAMRKNPLYRALRVDKLTLAALDVVLALHEAERFDEIPVRRMLALTEQQVRIRAEALAASLRETGTVATIEVGPGDSAVGGGAAPDVRVPTFLVRVSSAVGAGQVLERLRSNDPPVVARVADDRVVIDLRSVFPEEEADLLAALTEALSA